MPSPAIGSPQASALDLARIADAAAQRPDPQAALETLVAGVARVLRVPACAFEDLDRGWRLSAEALDGAAVLPIREARLALEVLALRGAARPQRQQLGGTAWTIVCPPRGHEAPRLAIFLAAEWPDADDALTLWAQLVSYALMSVRERHARRRMDAASVKAYAMARHVSRLENVETVCQRNVDHVADLLGADRVAIALHQPAQDCLLLAAAHGYPVSEIEDRAIRPGAWVLGHVHATRRPVFVSDVRRFGAAANRPYRTFSFGAVPMVAGLESIGVLAATDKRDGTPFDRGDRFVLRTAALIAGLAIVAARYDVEVHQLAYAATVDSLTGLLNRQALDVRMHQELERARRGKAGLALLVADIDDFKFINDSHGHLTGDEVLRAVGRTMRAAVRVFDVCARYGGDEFAVLMPGADTASAAACAERIGRLLAEHDGQRDGPRLTRALSMSVGGAVMREGDTAQDLFGRADRCLYQAKADGKNRVRVDGGDPR